LPGGSDPGSDVVAWGSTVVLVATEFGRTARINGTNGTDHGTAAPLFVMGSKVNAGLHGTPPDLDLKRNQDLTFSTDFRQVYAAAMERWMQCPSAAILPGPFAPLRFV
jgi:uncharacterized protein (DUF1501 family)